MTRRAWWALAADVVCVLVFVSIGRRSHDESGNAIAAIGTIAAPFLIGLGLAWLGGRVWRAPTAMGPGITVWVATVAAGMLLRHVVFDRGTALSFVIVAAVFLGLAFNGWRAVARLASP